MLSVENKRTSNICSTDELKDNEIKLMKETLITNGYRHHLIKKGYVKKRLSAAES